MNENDVIKGCLKNNPESKALNIPSKYNPINANPWAFRNPQIVVDGTTKPISTANTGNRAEQLIKGLTKIVINLSFGLLIVLVDIIAGIAQAPLEISETMLLPFIPNF